MSNLWMRNQMIDQVERRGIQPLQIVKEQGERMLLAGKDSEEAPEHHLEAVPGILRRQVRDRRLFSDHQFQLGNQVHNDLTILAQRLPQGVPPGTEPRLALPQKRADETLESLGQGGV